MIFTFFSHEDMSPKPCLLKIAYKTVGLKSTNILDLLKFKAFADDKIMLTACSPFLTTF